MLRYAYVLKEVHIINLLLISTDSLVITGKYQTSVFYVRSSPYRLGSVRGVKISV